MPRGRILTDREVIDIYIKLKNGIRKVHIEDEYKISKSVMYCIERKQGRYKNILDELYSSINIPTIL